MDAGPGASCIFAEALQRLGGTTFMDWTQQDSMLAALIRIGSLFCSYPRLCKGSMPAHPNYCRDASLMQPHLLLASFTRCCLDVRFFLLYG